MNTVLLIASLAVHSAVTNGVEVRWFEEMVPMRDGARLYTYGALPPPGVKCATVFERSPYVKEMPVDMVSLAFGDRDALARGYVRVRQHVRGCGMSEGEHIVYVDERADGLASLEWIRTLPHYNGEVYLTGASYCASVHWSYLDAAPADVKGAVLTVQDVNRYNIHYRNGNYKAALHGNWVVREHRKKNRSLKRDPSVKFTDLPLKGFSVRRLGEYVADLEESWDHPRPEDRWWSSAGVAGGEYRRALLDSKIPVMLVTGFYDIYTEGIFDMWRELPAERRANCALVVDTGDHPTRDQGEDGALDWFDWCRGKGSLRLAKPGMTVWHGVWADRWKSASEITDAPKRLVLHLADEARLSSVESDCRPVSFAYDPKNPPRFNSVGCLTFGGMKEQPETGWRTDVVSFVSEPFEKAVEVRGRMRLRLRVSSDCEDTAFYVRLSARKSDGKWYNLRDDIKTILWDCADYCSGEDVEIVYKLSDHAFTLATGDVMRLEIAGASAEQFIPHVNFKGSFSRQRQTRVAHNTIRGGVLMLPVENGEEMNVDVDLMGAFPKNIKCVHLVAPSSLPPKDVVVKATNALVRAGYRVKVSPGVWTYAPDGAQRARYLELAWKDPETDIILCGRGGRGGYDTVTNLDFSVLRSRDVPFVGFSNISCLMNAFVAKGVGRPISGPMCTSMVGYPTTRDSIERLSATVAGKPLEETRLKVLRPAISSVSGKPIGGHWPSISRMDREWLPSTDGRIVFLEVNKTYSLEKAKAMFLALKCKGYFARPAAVVLCDLGISGTEEERKDLVRFLVGELSCPVFQGYPYGHVSRCYAIDYDRMAEISSDGVLSWKARSEP